MSFSRLTPASRTEDRSSPASFPRPPPPTSSPPVSFSLLSTSSSLDISPRSNTSAVDGSSQTATSGSRLGPSSGRVLSNSTPASTNRTGPAVNKIEQIIEAVVDSLNRGQELSIPFSRRVKSRARDGCPAVRLPPAAQHQERDAAKHPRGSVSFPGKTEAESKLFSAHSFGC